MKLQNFILVVFVAISYAHAQPAPEWMHIYDGGGSTDGFRDIYRTDSEGYVCCGEAQNQLWIVRVDNDGNEIWSELYGGQDIRNGLRSIIETDSTDLVAGGRRDNQFTALMVNCDGEVVWDNNYENGQCNSVIELKSGEFLLTGINGFSNGLIICVDYEGNVEWQEEYIFSNRDELYCQRETDGGVIVASNSYFQNQNPCSRVVVFKIGFDGDIVWTNEFFPEASQTVSSMISREQGGFCLSGRIANGNFNQNAYDSAIFFVNNQGDLIAHNVLVDNDAIMENGVQIASLQNNDFVIVGFKAHSLRPLETDTFYAMRFSPGGQQRWLYEYRPADEDGFGVNSNGFNGVIEGHDGSIVGAGGINCEDGTAQNGVIIKLHPEVLEPQFIYFAPEDTVFSVLPGTEVEFYVHVEDDQDDALDYQWTRNAEPIGMDTTVTATFEELGEEQIHCTVSDGEFTVRITWHVTICNFFIDSVLPDSSVLTIRRNSEIDFRVNALAVEPDELRYEWIFTDRENHRSIIGELDTASYLFDLAGECRMTCRVRYDVDDAEKFWRVDVRSAVWWWMPHEGAISVNRNDRRDFSVFAFDPDSDSLSIGWWLDGDSLDSNAEVLTLDFPDVGEHSLVSIVRDGIEADTIRWAITVNESGVGIDQNGIPIALALHPPAPNPFNSTTTIGYSLPIAGNVSLAVYDLSGREVGRLVDGTQLAGNHEVVWTADGVASGVYVVAMDAGGVMLREKVVLVK